MAYIFFLPFSFFKLFPLLLAEMSFHSFERPFHLCSHLFCRFHHLETLTYLRLCSLHSGCCRDLHKASTPLSPIEFRDRFTFLSSVWPEHKAADRASMDAAVKSQLSVL